MPFDGRQFQQSPFSLDSLIAWLETKDPAQEYDWNGCNGACLFEQWGAAITGYGRSAAYNAAINGLDSVHPRRPFLDGPERGLACPRPHTFGAALSRAKAYRDQLAKESI